MLQAQCTIRCAGGNITSLAHVRGPCPELSVLATCQLRRRSRALHVRAAKDGGKPGAPESTPLDPFALVTAAGRAVWGKGLPPGALVQVAKESWKAAWKVMMSQLAPSNASGAYQRPASAFRHQIAPEDPVFVPEAGRYVLYAALSCPWAHRTLIVHRLKGLDGVVPLCIARPGDSGLWEFASSDAKGTGGKRPLTGPAGGLLKATPDLVNGRQKLKEVYQMEEGGYDGRSTVPMLWDTKTKRVVNNESADIIKILDAAFTPWAANSSLELRPPALATAMDAWDNEIYENVNNGVYCCGFATTQTAYEAAVERLFATLDKIDARLASSRFLCGESVTLSDIRLFTTLIRFDVAYHGIFKCSRQKIAEYPNLSEYLRDIYQIPGVAETCDVSGVGQSYYGALFPLNPGGIVPVAPRSSLQESLMKPHGRGKPLLLTAAAS